jgi:UDP-N-acetylmuramate dehydrogenase
MREAPPYRPRGALRIGESMAPHTSWRVGGPADRFFEPADREDLLGFLASLPATETRFWLGMGSNLLVRDGGLRATVLAIHTGLSQLRMESNGCVYAEAGVHCARLAKFAVDHGLAGSEFFAGIPGTVGGALVMNAGAWGGETWRVVDEVEVLDPEGRASWLAASAFSFGYREVRGPEQVAAYLAARLRFEPDPERQARGRLKSWLAERKATQPVGKPSCGSVFRNPPGDHAARLIEAAGLKGARRGDAVVSLRHSNFIINEGAARAADVEGLIHHVQAVVRERFGIELHPEVRIVGEVA